MEILEKVESKYFAFKKSGLNSNDAANMEALRIAEVCAQCYLEISQTLGVQEPDFDSEKMGEELSASKKQLRERVKSFNKLKGGFFGLHSDVINKDPLGIALDRLIQVRDEQERIIEEYPVLQEKLEESVSRVKNARKKYEGFETNLFSNKVKDTNRVMADTNELCQLILKQSETLKKDAGEVKDQANAAKQRVKDRFKKVRAICESVNKISRNVLRAEDVIYLELRNKDFLSEKFSGSQKDSEQPRSGELQDMLAISRKMKGLVMIS